MEYNYKIYFLFGLVILGMISQGFSKPTTQDDEYMHDEDYEEDDDLTPPENKPTENSPTNDAAITQSPFFPTPHEKYHVKLGSSAELKCPAKQLSSTNVVLWYKEDNVVSNGKQLAIEGGHFKLEDNYSLVIQNATVEDGGNYYCKIIPQEIKLHVEVQIDEEDSSPEEQQQPPAEHNQAGQVGQVTATETSSNENGSNGQISQSIVLTSLTIVLSLVLRI